MYNTISSNTIKQTFKEDDIEFNYLHCKQCDLLLGASFLIKNNLNTEITNNKEEFNLITNNNNDKKEIKYILLKSKIKVKQTKELICNIIGIKQGLINDVKNNLDLVTNNNTDDNMISVLPKIKYIINKENKKSLNEYVPKKNQNDINIIVHKIEGRVFLLGKNGYYNVLIDNFNSKYHNNVYFMLVIKELEENKKEELFIHMLDELICKGGQERLGYYRDHNKILFVNDFNLEEDVQSRKNIFHELLKSRYENLSEDYSRDESVFCIDINISKDKELIKKIARYEMNGGNNIFSKCNLI